MNPSIVCPEFRKRLAARPDFLDRFARTLVHRLLQEVRFGTIRLTDDRGTFHFGESPGDQNPVANLQVNDSRFYGGLILGGSIGAAESFMAGFWDCDDLVSLIRIILQNQAVMQQIDSGFSRLTAPIHRLFAVAHRNTKPKSRQNIHAHYDIGNELYELFLDDTMMYSCAVFENSENCLQEASIAKNERICRKLRLKPEDHLLEIGTGWGGFAIHAACRYGCRITTTTISRKQFEYAGERIRQLGLAGRVQILYEDYRDLKGKYDKIASIEMIEAVGHAYLETFFRQCGRLLKENGLMALQGITMTDQIYPRYIRSVDFIQRYIFPGGSIPSITALCQAATAASDLKLINLEDITGHYARTLREWRHRFNQNLEKVRCLGYPEPFIRMWLFYLCYCEAGFHERYIGDVQMTFAKPGWREGSGSALP